jgi:hypothetical protein
MMVEAICLSDDGGEMIRADVRKRQLNAYSRPEAPPPWHIEHIILFKSFSSHSVYPQKVFRLDKQ